MNLISLSRAQTTSTIPLCTSILKIENSTSDMALLDFENSKITMSALSTASTPRFYWESFAEKYGLTEMELIHCKNFFENDINLKKLNSKMSNTIEEYDKNLSKMKEYLRKIMAKTKSRRQIELVLLIFKNFYGSSEKWIDTNESYENRIRWDDFAQKYKLTNLEMEIIKALLNGETISEYAERTHRNVGTLRYQLNLYIFTKMKIKRQQELFKIIFTEYQNWNA